MSAKKCEFCGGSGTIGKFVTEPVQYDHPPQLVKVDCPICRAVKPQPFEMPAPKKPMLN